MPENRFLASIRAHRRPLQAWMWNPSVLSAEIIARTGFDSVCIDFQHGAMDFNDLYAIMAVVSANGATPMVRIPHEKDLGWVSRCLDGRAYGVICPDVQTPESARAFADACKYAPAGRRGFGPVRPVLGAPGSAYPAAAGYDTAAENAAVMAIVQIESPAGLDNVEAIVATPGVDGVFPGMVDYGLLAHGEVITDFSDPRIREPIERIMVAARAAGKPVGLPAIMPDAIPYLLELDVDWIQVGNDVSWITAAARNCVTHARAAIASHARKQS